jgi:excisionase family DNA binding protein
MPTKDFYTAVEAAQRLNVSATTLRAWASEGKVPAYRVGTAYRFPVEAIDAMRVGEPHDGPSPTPLPPIDLTALLKAWEQDMACGAAPLAPDTCNTHRRTLRQYLRALGEKGLAPRMALVEILSPRSLEAVLADIPVLKFSSRHNTYCALMNFARFLVRRGLINEPVRTALKVCRPKRVLAPQRTVLRTVEEVERFFDAILFRSVYAPSDRLLNAAIVGLMVYAGLRASEVAELQFGEVDLANRRILVTRTKGGRPRLVGVNDRLHALLARYLEQRDPKAGPQLLVNTHGGPLTRDLIAKRIRRIARSAGLTVTSHGLRRTFATLAADAGKSLNHLQLALGHRSITTTQMYLMANEATAAREMAGW